MSSGVAVDDAVVTKYQELKLGHAYRYCFFKMNDQCSQVVVDKTGATGASYEDFVKELPPNACRYAIFDFAYDSDDGRKSDKIIFVLWAPDSAKIKEKMLYTSSKDAVRKKLVGVGTEIQATDLAEIDREVVLEKVKRP